MVTSEELMARFSDLTYKFESNMPEKQKGLYINNVVYLNPQQHPRELTSTVAEEIGHHLTSVGDIIDQDTNEKRKQEQKARDIGATMVVTPQDLINCYHERFTYVWECADFLGITKQALECALAAYSKRFPEGLVYDDYKLFFKPNGTLGIVKWF
ncbi:ImmA/IrrE family metallo-endopeptidase [Enterococcus faecalis]|uniref:ImmA/IrrE family metallo-endopeptidase n=1 Tax=Enterococcus faecalis TaxID=1351 RepID=UPI0003EA4887|nr:ImmA/IrrE family metallo-endopeptidase [Enterococcus faecalis]AHI40556.1 Conserved phage protein [Enterococcus faecalis DENG1]EGO7724608.1 ImmA/IrrE family metallo-endopeptidase [Enterococcus faecalis]EGO7995697.1 ImmA/IrrE family metallo-endopeptidase [Enterococcus faecalis]EGO8315888.1 ImmA/IrrE family metallo-endopeptidase [Enterococcus faecalis]EGO8415134.1 ImmA/IrrE family metallo-endopeptidase [Enterococcus faecalis]